MKTYVASLESISPMSQSRYHDTPPLDKEQPIPYEARTWKNRLHVNEHGFVLIPPMMVKNTLTEAAKFLSERIPGKGKATYTKHFEVGIVVVEPIVLPVKADDVQGEWLFVPATGKRGEGSRVKRCFPLIQSWKGDAVINVIDQTITQAALQRHLEAAGTFIGFGRFRPRNNGYYGRFRVTALKEA